MWWLSSFINCNTFCFPNFSMICSTILGAWSWGQVRNRDILKTPIHSQNIHNFVFWPTSANVWNKIGGTSFGGHCGIWEKFYDWTFFLTKLNCCPMIRWPNWTVTQHQAQPCKRSASGSTWREHWWRFRRNERALKLHWPLTSWNMARDSTPLWALIQIQVRGKIGVKLDIWILEMTSFLYLYCKWM